MTAADEIRRAAAKVRETAAKATPGPWERPLNTRYKHSVTAAKPDDEQGQYRDGRPERVGIVQLNIWSDGRHMRKRGGRDLEWIALMSPDKAEPLAALLEEDAENFDWLIANAAGRSAEVRQEARVRATEAVARSLALARVINGGAS